MTLSEWDTWPWLRTRSGRLVLGEAGVVLSGVWLASVAFAVYVWAWIAGVVVEDVRTWFS